MRLLVVEDERDLAQTLRRALEEEQFAVDLAEDGEEGLFKMRELPYDAVVLDLMLPGMMAGRSCRPPAATASARLCSSSPPAT